MGDIARCSIEREDLLYKLFGVNAELLIDHAWGWEPVTMDMIKAYRPETSSVSSGQVLQSPYTAAKARNVVLEMADSLSLDLVDKKLVTDQLVLTVGYDTESLTDRNIREKWRPTATADKFRLMPTEQPTWIVRPLPGQSSWRRPADCSTVS